MIGVDRGARSGELGGGGLCCGRRDLFETVHQLANFLLERRQLADERVDLLEITDDLALQGFALRAARHRVEAARDLFVLGPQGRERGIRHQTFADSFTTASSATFSVEERSREVLSTMIVRAPSPVTTMPVMYSAARPLTMPGGGVTSVAATCSTSVTASTTTPILAPSHSRITVRVSSRCGAGTPSRLRRSMSGTAVPWYCSTPSRKSGALGSGAGAS